jgi:hypothetical protein
VYEVGARCDALRDSYHLLPQGAEKEEVFRDLMDQDYRLYLLKEKLAELRTSISLRER